ncbi:hypothetical protein HC761_00850 [bacterium]|nr:hypothetical protein [bacterium]
MTATELPIIRLKTTRKLEHPWIFSSHIEKPEAPLRPGSLVHVHDASDRWLAYAHYNGHARIALRVLSPHRHIQINPLWFQKRIDAALALREALQIATHTDAYRLVHAEGDQMSGVVIDRLADVIVTQFFSAGCFVSALIFAPLQVFLRDIRQIVSVAVALGFWLTPGQTNDLQHLGRRTLTRYLAHPRARHFLSKRLSGATSASASLICRPRCAANPPGTEPARPCRSPRINSVGARALPAASGRRSVNRWQTTSASTRKPGCRAPFVASSPKESNRLDPLLPWRYARQS